MLHKFLYILIICILNEFVHKSKIQPLLLFLAMNINIDVKR